MGPVERKITIGYLQVGPPEHGICRHGRLLAGEGRARLNVTVVERSVRLSGHRFSDRRELREVAEELSSADVVHLQVSVAGDTTWGRSGRSLRNLRTFGRYCRAPMIVTLHDVNNLLTLNCKSRWSWLLLCVLEVLKMLVRPAVRLGRQIRRGDLHIGSAFRSVAQFDALYPYRVARWVARGARILLVASRGEATTLQSMGLSERATTIPLFVEEGPAVTSTACDDSASRKTVIVAGFIFKSKGYDLMIEALSLLPDVRLVLVGGPRLGVSGSHTSERLMDLARKEGLADRVHMTGYLPDEEYHRHLAAADLAVCPFEPDKSASASLSSLIAAGCPILASDTPLIAEYNAIAPGALTTFSPYTPEALAQAVSELLRKPRTERTGSLAELRTQLSIRTIYDQHLEVYARVRAQ